MKQQTKTNGVEENVKTALAAWESYQGVTERMHNAVYAVMGADPVEAVLAFRKIEHNDVIRFHNLLGRLGVDYKEPGRPRCIYDAICAEVGMDR